MLLLRRIGTGVVVAAALAVLILAVYLLWNARQWDYLPIQTPYTSDLDARAQLFQDKLEIYSRRVNDMESLVIILLGITGLYTIVFILTADFNTRSLNRQVNRALENVDEKIGASLGELRNLKDDTRETLQNEVRDIAERLGTLQEQSSQMLETLRAELHSSAPAEADLARGLEQMERRIAEIAGAPVREELKYEVMHYEGALATLELFYPRQFAAQLGAIYRILSRYYAAADPGKARFYLGRASAMAPDDFTASNELGAMAMNGTMHGSRSQDYGQAKRHFEASLKTQPEQQRATFGLALIAKAEGDLETAETLLETALKSDVWETAPDDEATAEVHYALACVLGRRGQMLPPGRRAQVFLRAIEELEAAFAHPSTRLEDMLSRDIEEGGDLSALANTTPYRNAIDDLLLNVKVGVS